MQNGWGACSIPFPAIPGSYPPFRSGCAGFQDASGDPARNAAASRCSAIVAAAVDVGLRLIRWLFRHHSAAARHTRRLRSEDEKPGVCRAQEVVHQGCREQSSVRRFGRSAASGSTGSRVRPEPARARRTWRIRLQRVRDRFSSRLRHAVMACRLKMGMVCSTPCGRGAEEIDRHCPASETSCQRVTVALRVAGAFAQLHLDCPWRHRLRPPDPSTPCRQTRRRGHPLPRRSAGGRHMDRMGHPVVPVPVCAARCPDCARRTAMFAVRGPHIDADRGFQRSAVDASSFPTVLTAVARNPGILIASIRGATDPCSGGSRPAGRREWRVTMTPRTRPPNGSSAQAPGFDACVRAAERTGTTSSRTGTGIHRRSVNSTAGAWHLKDGKLAECGST